jgi:hypothetical protein
MAYWKHFCTITRHKRYVMIACFRCGLYKQGLLHDLSKYGATEFWSSARYFQGTGSPIDKEKAECGYSLAWQNHKGKNRHHWHYWTDFTNGRCEVLLMPPRYVIEMVCDWVGAGKAYNRVQWTIDTLKAWYAKNAKDMVLHTSVKNYIDLMMEHVADENDLYKSWLVERRINDNYFQDVCEGCAYQPKYDLAPHHGN